MIRFALPECWCISVLFFVGLQLLSSSEGIAQEEAASKSWFEPKALNAVPGQVDDVIFGSVDGDELRDVLILTTGDSLLWFEENAPQSHQFGVPFVVGFFGSAHSIQFVDESFDSGIAVLKGNGMDLLRYTAGAWSVESAIENPNVSSMELLINEGDTLGFAATIVSNGSDFPRGLYWFERDSVEAWSGLRINTWQNLRSAHAELLSNGNIALQARDNYTSIVLVERESDGSWNSGSTFYSPQDHLGVEPNYPENYYSYAREIVPVQLDEDCLHELAVVTGQGDVLLFNRNFSDPGQNSSWTYGNNWHVKDFAVNSFWKEATTSAVFAERGRTPLYQGVFVLRENARDMWQPGETSSTHELTSGYWDEILFFGLDDSGINGRQLVFREFSNEIKGMTVERTDGNTDLLVWHENSFQLISQEESSVVIPGDRFGDAVIPMMLPYVTEMSPVDFDRDGDLDLVLEKMYPTGNQNDFQVYDGTAWLENVQNYSWEHRVIDGVTEFQNKNGYCGYSLVPLSDGTTSGEYKLQNGQSYFRSLDSLHWSPLEIVSGDDLEGCGSDIKKEIILQDDLDGDEDLDFLYWTVDVESENGGSLGWFKKLADGTFINYPLNNFALRFPELSVIIVNPLSGNSELVCRLSTQDRTTWTRLVLDADAGFPQIHFTESMTDWSMARGDLQVAIADTAIQLITVESVIDQYWNGSDAVYRSKSRLGCTKLSLANSGGTVTESIRILDAWDNMSLIRLNDDHIAIAGTDDFELLLGDNESPILRQASKGKWKGPSSDGLSLEFNGDELEGFQANQLTIPFSGSSNTSSFTWIEAQQKGPRIFHSAAIPMLPNYIALLPSGELKEWTWSETGVIGCQHTLALNYDAESLYNHGCVFDCEPLYAIENELFFGGCTDSNASNFNPAATYDNGECQFPTNDSLCTPSSESWNICLGSSLDTTFTVCFDAFIDSLVTYQFWVNTEQYADFITVTGMEGDTLFTGSGSQSWGVQSTIPCFDIHYISDASISCLSAQNNYTIQINQSTSCPALEFEYSIGCMDANACNYNADATAEGLNSCTYPDCSGICGGTPHAYDPYCGSCYPLDSLELLDHEVFEFEYTGTVQVFDIPANAMKVKIEAWGAQGGGDISIEGPSNGPFANGVDLEGGGPGGYITGTYGGSFLDRPLYIVVGEFGGYQPIDEVNFSSAGSGEFNGGGASCVFSLWNDYLPSIYDSWWLDEGWTNDGNLNSFSVIAGGGGAGWGRRVNEWDNFWDYAEDYSGDDLDSLLLHVSLNRDYYWDDFNMGAGGSGNGGGSSWFAGYDSYGWDCGPYEVPPSDVVSNWNPVDWENDDWCINDASCLFFRDDWEGLDGPGFNFNRLPSNGQRLNEMCWTPWWDNQFQEYELNNEWLCENIQNPDCASDWILAGFDWVLDLARPVTMDGFDANSTLYPSFGGGGKGENFNLYEFDSFNVQPVIGLGGGGGSNWNPGRYSIANYSSWEDWGYTAGGGESRAPGVEYWNDAINEIVDGQQLTGVNRGHGKVRLTVYYSGLICEQGCMDELACNFDEFATEDDGSCEYESCLGCTDENACNYHPANLIEDESCDYETCADCGDEEACNYNASTIVSDNTLCEYMSCAGCLDNAACNYDASASIDSYDCVYPEAYQNCAGDCYNDQDGDGVCDENEISGCTYAGASNYDPDASDEDGSCVFEGLQDVYGCTYETACNYNPDATSDDGSCTYPEMGYNCDGECLVDSDSDGICNEFEGCTNPSACNFDPTALDNDGSCYFALDGLDCDGDCLNDVDADGICDADEIPGCTDFSACNYNALASDDDGTCTYPNPGENCAGECLLDYDGDGVCDEFEVEGCTIDGACNYSTSATENDGSCYFAELYYNCNGDCQTDSDGDGICDELEIPGCTYAWADNFNPLATDDDGSCEFMTDPVPGCIYPTACNYQPEATADDGSCVFPTLGYTCSGACIVDTDNDGVCDMYEIPGCMDLSACNYNGFATDATECNYLVPGYDCDGNCILDGDGDGICDPVEGCTNPLANNYDESATSDDGSCTFDCTDCLPVFINPVVNSTVSCTSELPDSPPAQFAISPCDSIPAQVVSVLIESSDDPCLGYRTFQHLALNLTCGNFTIAYETISVAENSAPEFVALPQGLVFACDEEVDFGEPIVVDPCSPFSIEYSDEFVVGACPSSFEIIRTIVATDVCGNTANDAYSVSVVDTVPPELLAVPGSLIVACGDEVPEMLPEVSDDCSNWVLAFEDVEAELTCPSNRLITRTFSATDECGNATQAVQEITILDEVAPTLEFVPADLVMDCGLEVPVDAAIATDACSEFTMWSLDSIIAGECPQEETIFRSHYAEDACGNQVSAVQIIEIVDEVAPVISGDPLISIDCSEVDAPLVIAMDVCGESSLMYTSTGIGEGIFAQNEVRIHTATDDCGNSSNSIQLVEYTDGIDCGGCTYPDAQNYDPEALFDDGTCVFCSCATGTVWSDEQGACIINENSLIAACGEGTYWDPVLQTCMSIACAGDLDGDGVRGVSDLLALLSMFGSECE